MEVQYNKNINEKYKKKETKVAKKSAEKITNPVEETILPKSKKCNVETNIRDFIKEMRRKNEIIKESQRSTNDDEEDITSTQMMLDDARARRDLKTKEATDRFKCDMCDFTSGSNNLMKRHKMNHQNVKTNQGIWTRKEVFDSTSQPEITGTRVLPLPRVIETKDTWLACDQCEFKSSQKDQMEHHIKSVHEKRKYTCEQCEFASEQKDEVKKHKESIHEKSKVKKKNSKYVNKRINCDLCEKKFNKKETFVTHMAKIHKIHHVDMGAADVNGKSNSETLPFLTI